jgi:uncharacterized protein YijF (DUF1287 family)
MYNNHNEQINEIEKKTESIYKKKNLSYSKQWNVHRRISNIRIKRIYNLLAIVLRYCTHHVHHKNNRSVLLCTHTMVDKQDPKKQPLMN